MTSATTRQWLTGFFLALLVHLGLALLLAATWNEPSRDEDTAGMRAGVNITLFPDFGSALQDAVPENPRRVDAESSPLAAPAVPPQELASLSPESPLPRDAPDVLPPLSDRSPAAMVTRDAVAALEAAPDAPSSSGPFDRSEPMGVPEILTMVETAVIPEPVVPTEMITPVETVALATALMAPERTLGIEPLAVVAPGDRVGAAEVASAVTAVHPVTTAEHVAPAIPDGAPVAAWTVQTPPRVEPVGVDPTAGLSAAALVAPPETVVPPVLPLIEAASMVGAPPGAPASIEPFVPKAAAIEPLPAATLAGDPARLEPVTAVDSAVLEISTPAPTTLATATADPLAASAEPQPIRDEDQAEALADPPPDPADGATSGEVGAERLAEAPSESPETAAPRASPGIEEAYFAALRAWLDRHKDYPRLAQRRGEEGTVLLRFTVNRYGMVLDHAIVQSSGHVALDNSVEHLIRRAQPLPWIPPEMGVDWLQVIIPVQFRLER